MFSFRTSKQELNTRPRDSIDSPASLKNVPLDSKEAITEEKKLVDKILSLYQAAWLGIYQAHDKVGRSHASRLAELFYGAGMSSYVDKDEQEPSDLHRNTRGRWKAETRVLDPLWTALSKEGLSSLKLFEGLSVASLESVIELVEAYVKEVASVNALYKLLRDLQVGFRTPTEDDEQTVLKKFVPALNDFARRLRHLDARLNVLVTDLEEEFWNKHGAVKGREGWRVHDVLFPRSSARTGKKISLSSSMKV
ncbi:hypothetical protein N7481_006740 [Penicillium waksmanii]|uniref:uncharacterized protein n=1 Tax=Penicillium waksmanii TaxID=69791 RepID=UPI002548B2B7|nr:uncharacterized protein N7481_006740 [Penicillium waksmanii]KAJ5984641.1 hypothetical protein N7481_006740 [Penicillium waksmanii]